jgi:hypothetical protein
MSIKMPIIVIRIEGYEGQNTFGCVFGSFGTQFIVIPA